MFVRQVTGVDGGDAFSFYSKVVQVLGNCPPAVGPPVQVDDVSRCGLGNFGGSVSLSVTVLRFSPSKGCHAGFNYRRDWRSRTAAVRCGRENTGTGPATCGGTSSDPIRASSASLTIRASTVGTRIAFDPRQSRSPTIRSCRSGRHSRLMKNIGIFRVMLVPGVVWPSRQDRSSGQAPNAPVPTG